MSEGRGGSLPGQPAQMPGLPENFRQIMIEGFLGLNTKVPRPAIQDQQLSICDGWMPVGPNMLRVLPGTGPVLYTSGTPGDIVWFGFGNIGDQPYCFVLHTNGSMTAVTVPGGAASTIMSGGTIISPRTVLGFSQWSSLYELFSNDQNNGYWLWDGTSLFSAGTASPIVDITDGGAGYGSPPSVTAHGGSGSGITLAATLDNGAVAQVMVTSPGSGYQLDDQVILLFNGSGTRTAYGVPVITNGVITSVTLLDGGSGYQSGTGVQQPPTVTVTDTGSGSGALIVVDGMAGGIITSLKIVAGGANYASPSISFSGSGGAAAVASAQNGVITGFSITDGGAGYATTPTVQFISATGSGATAMATINGGAVTAVTIITGGSGYTGTVWGVFVGGNGPATATIEMMPFGISGTSLEVYQGHVWVANGAARAAFPPKGRVIYSAGGTPVNYGGDGGAFLDTNSFARVGYHFIRQSNGFLYLVGDSSLDYVSGVQSTTTGMPPVTSTSFNNQNADPQIGTPWPSSGTVYSRNIVFANSIGIYVSLGGTVTKVSTPLDGFYASTSITGSGDDFPSAVAEIFGNVVYMLLLPIVDQVTGATVNKLLMWDAGEERTPSRWFTSSQDRTLTYINTLEINSVLQAWGTDGTHIFPLFYQGSNAFTKTFQSKLFSNPAYWMTKTANELFGLVVNPDGPLTITVDNELGLGSGGGSVSVLASSSEVNVFGPVPCGQIGSLLGLTVSTAASDATIMSLTIIAQDEATRV